MRMRAESNQNAWMDVERVLQMDPGRETTPA
jgi:hypothetical protein